MIYVKSQCGREVQCGPVARRLTPAWEGAHSTLLIITLTSIIFALISSVPSTVGLYHVVCFIHLASHIIMGKIETDI